VGSARVQSSLRRLRKLVCVDFAHADRARAHLGAENQSLITGTTGKHK
jgi:hypothetical protein